MSAVILQGGKQYKIVPGATIKLEKISGNVGDKVDFKEVLYVNNGTDIKIGTPMVEDFSVVGEIIKQYKGKKILIVKKKRRKGYRRINGHRQFHTDVKILSVGDELMPTDEKPVINTKSDLKTDEQTDATKLSETKVTKTTEKTQEKAKKVSKSIKQEDGK